jgi:hypothetical protein
MNELLYTPQDHKSNIYSFLDIQSLIRVGSVCKSLHDEKIRILILLQKVVDSYFYSSSAYTGIVRNWMNFPYEKLFYEIYFQRLKKISFNDLEIVKDSNTNHIQYIIIYNQLREIRIEESHSDRIIHIFTDPIMKLDSKERCEIYRALFTYLGQLFTPIILKGNHLESLGKSIHQSLRILFKCEKDEEMRKFMIYEIDKITEITRTRDEDIYTLKDFLFTIYEDIIDIIEIGQVLLSLNRKKEFKYLFDIFIMEISEDMVTYSIHDTYYQMKSPYKGCVNITYEKKLSEMLKNLDNESLKKFELLMYQMEDIIYPSHL